MFSVISFLFFLILIVSAAKLPATFQKCNKNSNDCLSKAVKDALQQLDKPFKEVNLPSLDPLEIPALTIGAGSGPVDLQQNFKNVKIYGFNKPKDISFSFDSDAKNGLLRADFPELKILADYDINGKVLLLQVHGKGPATISMQNLHGETEFRFDEYEKNGEKYLKVVNTKLSINPSLVTFNFDNLFDGDENLGNNINKVVNDNWKEVFGDVKSNYEEAFATIIQSLFNNLLGKVPIAELFNQ